MRPCGGDEEVRTPDPLRARQVLSQLSYTPAAIHAAFEGFDTLKIEQHLALHSPVPFTRVSPCADQSSETSYSPRFSLERR